VQGLGNQALAHQRGTSRCPERLITDSLKSCLLLKDYFDLYKPQTNHFNIRYIRWDKALYFANEGIWFQKIETLKRMIKLNKKNR
jgi:hypothetical protein